MKSMKTVALCLSFFPFFLLEGAFSQSVSSDAQQTNPASISQNTPVPPDAKADAQNDEHHLRYHLRLGAIGIGAGYSRFSGSGSVAEFVGEKNLDGTRAMRVS